MLEVGYRLNANFTVAALFQYGFAQINSGGPIDCSGTPGIDCSASIMRLGIEAIYNLNLAAPLTPWVGIGTGYEWFSYSVSGGGQSGSVGARGFEFVTLHAGGDYFAAPNFAIGPFLSFSLAQYANVSGEAPGMSIDMEITDKSMHQWLQMGVRGRFGL